MSNLLKRDQLGKLSTRAIIGLASRCAARVQPLFPHFEKLDERGGNAKFLRVANSLGMEFALGFNVLKHMPIEKFTKLARMLHEIADADNLACHALLDISGMDIKQAAAAAAAAAAESSAFAALCTVHGIAAAEASTTLDIHMQSTSMLMEAMNAVTAASNAVGFISISHAATANRWEVQKNANASIELASEAARRDYNVLLASNSVSYLELGEPLVRQAGNQGDLKGMTADACLEAILGPLWQPSKPYWFV